MGLGRPILGFSCISTFLCRETLSWYKDAVLSDITLLAKVTMVLEYNIQDKTYSEEIHLVNSILELKTRND